MAWTERVRSYATALRKGHSRSYDQSRAALLASVAIQPVPLGACYHWIDGKAVDTPYVPGFHSHFMDLQSDPVCWVGVGFDYVHFHVPRSGLDDMALEYGVQPVGSYHQVIGVKDLVLAQITRTLLPHLGSPELTSSLALDQLGLILGVHVLQRYAGLPARAPIARGGLAPWQRRRATEMILGQVGRIGSASCARPGMWTVGEPFCPRLQGQLRRFDA